MAGASLFALLDDIASILDDVATMTKVAAKKTAGVLGDDLALNAQQVSGVNADRELPVIWAVAKGSALNKLILVPLALAISAWAPWGVMPLLVIGGAYLCYEGVEKLAHSVMHRVHEQAEAHPPSDIAHDAAQAATRMSEADVVQSDAEPIAPEVLEREKIRGAIRTDFVLSAEIVVIALGTVAGASLAWQVSVLTVIATLMTVGVYGLVAGIVKLDDAGFYLLRVSGNAGWRAAFGRLLLVAAPKLMHTLSVVGTAAMFMVGGGILTHGIPFLHHAIDEALWDVAALPLAGPVLAWLTALLFDMMVGVLAGVVLLAVVALLTRLVRLGRA